jgi:hypothetical protein
MGVPSVEMLLLAARAVFLIFSFVLAAVAFSRWRRATSAQTQQLLAQNDALNERLTRLESHLEAATAAIAQLGERLDRPRHLPTAGGPAAPGYQIAIRLARSGASRDELVSGCGLSQHEAELVQRLHGPQSGTTSRLKVG